MKFKSFIYILFMVLIFVEILVVFPRMLEESQKEEIALKQKAQEDLGRAEQLMAGVHLVESQNGQRDWELFAEKAEGDKETQTWDLKNIKIVFYTDNLAQFTVTGRRGFIEADKKNVTIQGNVETKSTNGYVFNSNQVVYVAKNRQIISNESVKMLAPKDNLGSELNLSGSAMVLDVNKKTMSVSGPVQATRMMKDGKAFSIEAGSALFSTISHEAKFAGQVKLQYDKMNLVGPEASFLYEKSQQLISQIKLNGGVEVFDAEKKALSQSVDFDLLSQKYVFKGSPKVLQGDDELQGDEIIFLDGGKKVKVERIRARMENK